MIAVWGFEDPLSSNLKDLKINDKHTRISQIVALGNGNYDTRKYLGPNPKHKFLDFKVENVLFINSFVYFLKI